MPQSISRTITNTISTTHSHTVITMGINEFKVLQTLHIKNNSNYFPIIMSIQKLWKNQIPAVINLLNARIMNRRLCQQTARTDWENSTMTNSWKGMAGHTGHSNTVLSNRLAIFQYRDIQPANIARLGIIVLAYR